MVRVVCVSVLLGLASAAQNEPVCEAGQCEEAEEVGLIQHGLGPYTKCITPADMDATIEAFMGAVVAIGQHVDNCTAAKEASLGALNAAYAYGVPGVTVQFKPTLTTPPDVYRPTQEGALSYFIGACVCPGVNSAQKTAPEGCDKSDGYYFPDDGFAFAPPEYKGWSKVERGGTTRGGKPGTNFWYNHGGIFCKAATAQGPICFTNRADGTETCVDKTFGFVPNPDRSPGALRALLSTHHSSSQVMKEAKQ